MLIFGKTNTRAREAETSQLVTKVFSIGMHKKSGLWHQGVQGMHSIYSCGHWYSADL